ncbi:MAG: hypothetical protein IPL83_16160 [Bdellovibrionales bacterium]|nr:hypothetical protein [Bdellovibrionales bacterium]
MKKEFPGCTTKRYCTGKAAVTPVKDKITGNAANADFEPCVANTGQSLKVATTSRNYLPILVGRFWNAQLTVVEVVMRGVSLAILTMKAIVFGTLIG